MKTNVYIDGFNLYYGAVKHTPYKWLNLAELFRKLLPEHQINSIKYFTAHVRSSPRAPDVARRQRTYLRALRTLPNLSIILGNFRTNVVTMPEIDTRRMVRVYKTEEKGSDVNLAVHLINDAHKGAFEAAVVASNDSDLLEPVKIVTNELGLTVGVINPHDGPSVIGERATFVKRIRKGVLEASQFPVAMKDRKGNFHKPASW